MSTVTRTMLRDPQNGRSASRQVVADDDQLAPLCRPVAKSRLRELLESE